MPRTATTTMRESRMPSTTLQLAVSRGYWQGERLSEEYRARRGVRQSG